MKLEKEKWAKKLVRAQDVRGGNEGKVSSIPLRVEAMEWRALAPVRSKDIKPGRSCRNQFTLTTSFSRCSREVKSVSKILANKQGQST